jgi:putative ABC transport system permease protein
VSLARRNLFQDKTRLVLSIGGVALAVMLILILKGFLAGMNRQITSYLDNSPGSIVIAEEDVVNLLGATSLIPEGTDQKAESVRGVERVIPLLSQFIILDLHSKKQPAYMVGYEPGQGGGPWRISEGHEPDSKWEMVLDEVLAERHGLVIGDQVEVMGRDFIIVGLSHGTTSWMTSYLFVRKQDAEKIMLAPGATSFLLVATKDDANEGYVIGRLKRFSGINVLTKKEMAANDLKLFAKVFSAPLRLMVGISFLVGTMIVGLVIYTATVERQREYGVIKAIGGRNRFLYRVVLTQAFFASIAGSTAGILMASGAAQWIMNIRPQFLIRPLAKVSVS